LGEAVPHKHLQTDEFVLKANHFALCSTGESIHVPNDMAAYAVRRSGIGRLRLQVQNAGFHGQKTLELEKQSGFPIVLKKGVRISRIVFIQMSQSAEKPYPEKYGAQQSGATTSLLEVNPEFS